MIGIETAAVSRHRCHVLEAQQRLGHSEQVRADLEAAQADELEPERLADPRRQRVEDVGLDHDLVLPQQFAELAGGRVRHG